MPGVLVGENDAVQVFAAAGAAVARARRGEGPNLVEVKTDRYLGHCQGDPETYRPKDEAQTLRANDPTGVLRARLRAENLLSEDDEAAMRNPSVFVRGEDVGKYGGICHATVYRQMAKFGIVAPNRR